MSFADWPVIALTLILKNDTRRARHKQYTHRHHIFPPHLHHTPVTTWAIFMPCMARCVMQQKSVILGLEYAKFSLTRTRSGIFCPYLVANNFLKLFFFLPAEFTKMSACEGERMELRCPKNKWIAVHSASFGWSENVRQECTVQSAQDTG